MIRPDQRIEVAERALGAGQQATAQRLLVSVVEDHPEQGYAWFLLSQTTDNAQQRSRYLHRAVQAGYTTTIPMEMLAAPATPSTQTPLLPTAGPAADPPERQPGATFLRGGCFALILYAVVIGLALLDGSSVTINLSWLAIWFVVGGVIALIGAAFNPRAS
jgi:hypothetical protein